MPTMTTHDKLPHAWRLAEGAVPEGWRIVGVVSREHALRVVGLRGVERPAWCALAQDAKGNLLDAWGPLPHGALYALADKLAPMRGD